MNSCRATLKRLEKKFKYLRKTYLVATLQQCSYQYIQLILLSNDQCDNENMRSGKSPFFITFCLSRTSLCDVIMSTNKQDDNVLIVSDLQQDSRLYKCET